jgi:hypothetical protein
MEIVDTLNLATELFWLWRHNTQVDVVRATYTEAQGLTPGTVIGPFLDENSAKESLREIVSIPPP